MDSLKVNQGPRRENKGLLVSKGGRYRARAMSDYENDPNFKGRVLVSLKPYVVRKVIVTMLSQMDISDRRQLGKVRFSAPSLIFTVSLAYLCGSRSACSMGKFWEHNRDFLAEVIPDFPHDLYVSHDTIKRTIENVVFENYAQFFTRFTQALLYESLNDFLALCCKSTRSLSRSSKSRVCASSWRLAFRHWCVLTMCWCLAALRA